MVSNSNSASSSAGGSSSSVPPSSSSSPAHSSSSPAASPSPSPSSSARASSSAAASSSSARVSSSVRSSSSTGLSGTTTSQTRSAPITPNPLSALPTSSSASSSSSNDTSTSTTTSSNHVLIGAVVGSVGGVLLLGGLALCVFLRRRQRRRERERGDQFLMDDGGGYRDNDNPTPSFKRDSTPQGWLMQPGTPVNGPGWAGVGAAGAAGAVGAGAGAAAAASSSNARAPHYTTLRGQSAFGTPNNAGYAYDAGNDLPNVAPFGGDAAWRETHYAEVDPTPIPQPAIGVVPPTPNTAVEFPDENGNGEKAATGPGLYPRHSTGSSRTVSSVYSRASGAVPQAYAYSGEDDEHYPAVPPGVGSANANDGIGLDTGKHRQQTPTRSNSDGVSPVTLDSRVSSADDWMASRLP